MVLLNEKHDVGEDTIGELQRYMEDNDSLHNDMIQFQLELAEKILELEREMDGFDGPPNSLYENLNKAKRKYEQLLDSSEGRMR
ncbi:hypothetical protein IV203_012561 [Nitzschia inconspicua]|uniref:Uncharacterized protein n=1 Tax=Nitzschia inconspicua TaxID=303405 RepID=A0A9K3PM21_9STRA|nr:hypothetical protein IV203_012561 [Nitzschia inconspicua]